MIILKLKGKKSAFSVLLPHYSSILHIEKVAIHLFYR